MVIDAGVIPHIIAALEVRNERPDILKEAALALSNITSKGTPKQLMICAIAGAVQVLIASLPRVEEDCQAEIMEGLFYYLVAGNATVQPGEPNPCAAMIVACGGVDPLAGFAIGEPDSPGECCVWYSPISETICHRLYIITPDWQDFKVNNIHVAGIMLRKFSLNRLPF